VTSGRNPEDFPESLVSGAARVAGWSPASIRSIWRAVSLSALARSALRSDIAGQVFGRGGRAVLAAPGGGSLPST
jgi:hypothetical protein